MKYNIRVNDVKSEDSQIKAFATVTFADSNGECVIKARYQVFPISVRY